MPVQTVEIRGERFVIIPETEFLALQNRATPPASDTPKRFRDIVSLRSAGVPASDMLIQDRR